MAVSELICQLSSALDGGNQEAEFAVLQALAGLLNNPRADEASEMDEILMDAWPLLMAATAQSVAADAAARPVLAALARHCTAREVFTLCMAALAENLSEVADKEETAVSGPASPAFQLCLLGTLQHCLPRIRRRPLHFVADLLHMQLRWAAEVLPRLPLGCTPHDGETPAEGQLKGQQSLTVAAAVHSLADMAGSLAGWAGGQLAEQERQAAVFLQGGALLQLTSLCLQLPQATQAASAAVEAAQRRQQAGVGAGGAAPAAGSRLPLMQAACVALLELPKVLLAAVAVKGAQPGSDTASPERMLKLAKGLIEQLASAGIDATDPTHFSATEAAEGAAAAACAAACSGSTPVEQQAERLRELLPAAACLLLDLGAQQQSVPLTLLPLCAICTTCSQLAGPTGGHPQAAATAAAASLPGPAGGGLRLAASTPALDRLLSALVAVMSYNPMQLIRSCAHDAVHAVLDAFTPVARLAQLRRLVQSPSSAASVVALQRLRQEMAAAWRPAGGTQACTADAPSAPAPPAASASCDADSGVWLSSDALGLALPCLKHGSEGGWHDEAGVLAAADVQAAALSLLRWVLLRERAAPRGLLPPPQAAALLRSDLLPLRACVEQLLQLQAAQMAGVASGGSTDDDGSSGVVARQRLDGFLAVQRLHEALGCVVDLLQQQAKPA